jgi:hypothetical protein
MSFVSVSGVGNIQTTLRNGVHSQEVELLPGAAWRTPMGLAGGANYEAVFESSFAFDKERVQWQEVLGGSGTAVHGAVTRYVTLTVTASASDSAVLQSREYHSGAGSVKTVPSGTIGVAAAGVVKRMGRFDLEDGVFLEQNGTTDLSLVHRSSVSGSIVDTRVLQANWSVDQFNGGSSAENPSGATLDITDAQSLVIEYDGRGVGAVRVGFMIGGEYRIAHVFMGANTTAFPAFTRMNLPTRFEIASDGSAGSSMHAIGALSMQELRSKPAGGFSASNGVTTVTTSATPTPVLTIRPKLTLNSLGVRAIITPYRASMFSNADDVSIDVVYGATLTGSPSFASVNADSVVEVDVAATGLTGGIILGTFHCPSGSPGGFYPFDIDSCPPLALDVAAAHPTAPYTDSLSLVATQMTGASGVSGSIMWREDLC